MDPATILSVIATSAKLAKSSWDLGEALYTFTKDAIIIDTTLQNLVNETRAVQSPCKLLVKLLEYIKADIDSHPEMAATKHETQLVSTLEVLACQLIACEATLDRLRQATEGIRSNNANAAKKAWAAFKLNLRRETMKESRSQLSMHLTALNTSLNVLNW